jgi:hypothetical protein
VETPQAEAPAPEPPADPGERYANDAYVQSLIEKASQAEQFNAFAPIIDRLKAEGITDAASLLAFQQRQEQQAQEQAFQTTAQQQAAERVSQLIDQGLADESLREQLTETFAGQAIVAARMERIERDAQVNAYQGEVSRILAAPENRGVPERLVHAYAQQLPLPQAVDLARAEYHRLRDSIITQHMAEQAARPQAAPVPAGSGAISAPPAYDAKNPMSLAQALAIQP